MRAGRDLPKIFWFKEFSMEKDVHSLIFFLKDKTTSTLLTPSRLGEAAPIYLRWGNELILIPKVVRRLQFSDDSVVCQILFLV
jgi:hypothetical protein